MGYVQGLALRSPNCFIDDNSEFYIFIDIKLVVKCGSKFVVAYDVFQKLCNSILTIINSSTLLCFLFQNLWSKYYT